MVSAIALVTEKTVVLEDDLKPGLQYKLCLFFGGEKKKKNLRKQDLAIPVSDDTVQTNFSKHNTGIYI